MKQRELEAKVRELERELAVVRGQIRQIDAYRGAYPPAPARGADAPIKLDHEEVPHGEA